MILIIRNKEYKVEKTEIKNLPYKFISQSGRKDPQTFYGMSLPHHPGYIMICNITKGFGRFKEITTVHERRISEGAVL